MSNYDTITMADYLGHGLEQESDEMIHGSIMDAAKLPAEEFANKNPHDFSDFTTFEGSRIAQEKTQDYWNEGDAAADEVSSAADEKTLSESFKTTGYAAFRENSNLQKKKGRPLGWKRDYGSNGPVKKLGARLKRKDSTIESYKDFTVTKRKDTEALKLSNGDVSQAEDTVSSRQAQVPTQLPLEVDHSAVAKVFATFELIEMVLLRTPMTTILQAQRVNKTFQHVTRRSLKLQQRLWFKPTNSQAFALNPLFHPTIAFPRTCYIINNDTLDMTGLHCPVGSYLGYGNESWQRMLLVQAPRSMKLISISSGVFWHKISTDVKMGEVPVDLPRMFL